MSDRFDWEEINRRLRRNEKALARALDPAPEEVAQIRRERALRLASRAERARQPQGRLSAFLFSLGDETYGIDLDALAEVLPRPALTPVPGVGRDVLGVVNHHGVIRPVLDPAVVLGVGGGQADDGFVLFLRAEGGEVGLLVDAVLQVRRVRVATLSHPIQDNLKLPVAFVRGVTDDAVAVLDAGAILAAASFTPVRATRPDGEGPRPPLDKTKESER